MHDVHFKITWKKFPANDKFPASMTLPQHTRGQRLITSWKKTRFPVVMALTDNRFLFDGYSTDIRQSSRCSTDSVLTNLTCIVDRKHLPTSDPIYPKVFTQLPIFPTSNFLHFSYVFFKFEGTYEKTSRTACFILIVSLSSGHTELAAAILVGSSVFSAVFPTAKNVEGSDKVGKFWFVFQCCE